MTEPNEPRNSDLLSEAGSEIKGMAKEGMRHPATKPVLVGGALGALAAGILPVVTWPIGLAAGAGFMLYKRLRP